tara:strand:+ start:624 stop:1145 length:522 start_codon:yes stop_codon:yes gene_type:complete
MSNASRLGSFFKSGSLSQLGSFLGSIGIAGSLLLVAYELKQSREIAELQFAYQRVEIKQILERPPVGVDHLEYMRILLKAADEGLEALTEDEKEVLTFSNIQGLDSLALRFETYRRGYLSESEWANDKLSIKMIYCSDRFSEIANHNIYRPMYSDDLWDAVTEIQDNADCEPD